MFDQNLYWAHSSRGEFHIGQIHFGSNSTRGKFNAGWILHGANSMKVEFYMGQIQCGSIYRGRILWGWVQWDEFPWNQISLDFLSKNINLIRKWFINLILTVLGSYYWGIFVFTSESGITDNYAMLERSYLPWLANFQPIIACHFDMDQSPCALDSS